MYQCAKGRVRDKIESFARFGAAGNGGVTRFSLSKEALAARREFAERMAAIGAEITTDDMANMYAVLPGSEAGLQRIVMGSHADSVRNGGNYDGILGVIAAMEVLESIALENIPHRHPLAAMIWTNEEGALYPPAMMSSGVVCGKFTKALALASKAVFPAGGPQSRSGTFGEALAASGFAGDEKNRLNPKDYCAMLELHIEQGPVLEAAKKTIGVVDGVVGMFNYRIQTRGQADHAGTTPMSFRRDALLAAADAIKWIHAELDKLGEQSLVYTTGEIMLRPNVHTVIPGEVEFSLDVRHWDPAVLAKALEIVKGIPREFDKCPVSYREAWSRKRCEFDSKLVGLVEKNARELGCSYMTMHSGPGHDAQYVSGMLPAAMIFVPSRDGRSHCEEEFTSLDDAWAGINVALNTVLDIDRSL
ncbi:MAG: Zn-dependent hydrolase [Treponema sp.]|jgi:N-carbamoyl-L-amino-acid hydrolase|nr:Zn-dependent hydrolase [Treponema sp.]